MIHWSIEGLLWLLAFGALIATASALGFRSWHHFAESARGAAGSALPRTGPETPLDVMFAASAAHPGLDSVMGLFDNADAFAARTHAAQQAGRSLDVMTYIWRTDVTGWLLLRDVLEAADRGVRVRLLLDDLYVQGFDPVFLALNRHPGIEVRLFNPIRNRGHIMRRALETVLGFRRYNRRLHAKTWIADGRLAIIGGRNIGDTYFGWLGAIPGAWPTTVPDGGRISRDTDVMLSGPVVAQIETVFDGYWNLGLVLPILALLPDLRVSLHKFRRRVKRHTETARARALVRHSLGDRDANQVLTASLRRAGSVRVLADPPNKAYGNRTSAWMADEVHELLASAQHDVRLITPYFVPGASGVAELKALAKRGVQVSILTNSLAASDNIFVHGAYQHYRAQLLAAGAKFYEFAPPRQGRQPRDVVHSKVFIIDRQTAIVGSLNFDQRSAYTNAELGVLVEEPELVAGLLAVFDADSAPDKAFALSLERGAIRWDVARPGLPLTMAVEPDTGLLRRGLSLVVGHLPINRWL